MSSNNNNMETTLLKLDGEDPDEHSRRLLQLPQSKDLVIYGGELGSMQFRDSILKQWEDDDDVRAIGRNQDGTLIVCGFESGAIRFYRFDTTAASNGVHPFVSKDPPIAPSQMEAGPTMEGSIRDFQFLNNDKQLVISHEAGLVVYDVESKEQWLQEEAKKAHDESGVRGTSISSNDGTIASLGMDGRLCLFRDNKLLHRDNEKCISKMDPGENLGADPWDMSSRPLFFKNNILVLPGEPFLQVRLLQSDNTVDTADQPVEEGHVEPIVCSCYQGHYVVSTGRDKRVVLWKWNTTTNEFEYVKTILTTESAPTDVTWIDTTLTLVCADGKLVNLRDFAVPKETAKLSTAAVAEKTSKQSPGNEAAPKEKASNNKQATYKKVGNKKANNNDDGLSSDEEDFGGGAASSPPKKSPFVDDEASDSNSVDLAPQANSPYPQPQMTQDDDDDSLSGDEFDTRNDDYRSAMMARPAPSLPLVEKQAAFAPSSSPLDLPRRFLVWNHMGSIVLRNSEEDRAAVDIHFTNAGFRRPISFTDNLGFIVGSLGEDGAVFATDLSEEDDEQDTGDDALDGTELGLSEATRRAVRKSRRDPSKATGSTVYFHRFETIARRRDKDWYLTLPSGERVLGCACGEGWAAVMTSRRFLRLFSSGGNQGQIMWLDGAPVTMVGRSRFLAVFYHQSEPSRDSSQNLGYVLLDATSYRVLAKGVASCVGEGATLAWVGFNNDGCLLAMDSDGLVSMLVSTSDANETWTWMPMLDTLGLRKSSDDSFWPVTIYDGKLVCVPLKGGRKHPDAARRPVTTALSLRLPFARGPLTKANALEELSVRASIALHQKRAVQQITNGDEEDEEFEHEYLGLSAQVDKVTLKMFAAIIEAGKLERALDLVERLNLEKSFDLAMTIADAHRNLVDLIEDAKDRKFGGGDLTTGSPQYHSDDDDETPRISPDSASRKRSLGEFGDRKVRPKSSFSH